MADERAKVVRLDHLGARRLSAREVALWYGLAGASYITLSIFHKWLLNWFIGPRSSACWSPAACGCGAASGH